MNIKQPLNDNIIIKKLEETEKQFGNIIVPDTGTEKSMIGEIIAVGKGRQNMNGDIIPTTVEVGEIVAFPVFGGQKLFLNDIEYFVYKESDLLTTLAE